ncbi:orotidine 5'-phosphate decarboxylase [Porphyromonas catoniae F0037]|jgi:orotidine 5'-phosphate decarboxylase|uniref:Orotidine-5'-phosphate decarboxylase n=1 Tax=Porphyromonas catoniae F0037 TaxID=1127696 RepID=L1NFH6_9PORP|nr:orotidine-5'-phosphate decarboxylase [Porphyromonas catoniae]EKY01952.1 orotidine 5'-phosphate decarboxylase [Porphyromonas catoniae F0037]
MTKEELFENIRRKKSFLCIGLDTDVRKIPQYLLSEDDPIFAFNKRIIDATAHLCVAYKPNLAFYESMGSFGILAFEKTIEYLRQQYPDQFIIADAKRGDIGNTSDMYARSFFEHLKVDALTVAPYMGSDSVLPFLKYTHHWVVLLALTSNEGAEDFQLTKTEDGDALFELVLKKSLAWGGSDQLMYVVGATKASMLERVRAIVPESFLLVPGVGSQNGSLEEVALHGLNSQCGLLVNASRSIIYADNTEAFASGAAAEAEKLRHQMADILIKNKLVEA